VKTAVFHATDQRTIENAVAYIRGLQFNEGIEIRIGKAERGKTLQQLGALFGVWVRYIVEQTGYTENEIHRDLKRMFLARIYAEEPRGNAQKAWVKLLMHLQEIEDWEGVRLHGDTISLAWAKVEQMRQYMDAIQQYYIGNGMPLPVPYQFRGVRYG